MRHKKLNHGNPLLPQVIELPVGDKEAFFAEMRESRGILKTMLSTVLLGDDVAAEYLISHLISKVTWNLGDEYVGAEQCSISPLLLRLCTQSECSSLPKGGIH